MRRPLLALAASALLMGGMVGAACKWLKVEVDFLGYFKRDHELSRAVRFFTERLSGPAPFELVVAGPPGAFRDPAALKKLDELQSRLQALTIVDRRGREIDPIDRAVSVADFVRAASRLEGGAYAIPDDPRRIAAYGFYASLAESGRGIDPLLSPDYGSARISARMRNIGSRESAALVDATHRLFDEVFGGDEGYTLTVTGAAVIFLEVAQTVTDSQISSFGLALVLVFGCMFALFRSARVGLISIPPNIFPICFTFGLMAIAGITLNMSTAMVASIAIGIAVDDTIHFLSAFRRRVAEIGDPARAAVDVCETLGPACLATTIVLCSGFGVSMLASFYPTIHFGALSAATIAAAFYGDFVVLPAILVLCWPTGPGCRLAAAPKPS